MLANHFSIAKTYCTSIRVCISIESRQSSACSYADSLQHCVFRDDPDWVSIHTFVLSKVLRETKKVKTLILIVLLWLIIA